MSEQDQNPELTDIAKQPEAIENAGKTKSASECGTPKSKSPTTSTLANPRKAKNISKTSTRITCPKMPTIRIRTAWTNYSIAPSSAAARPVYMARFTLNARNENQNH